MDKYRIVISSIFPEVITVDVYRNTEIWMRTQIASFNELKNCIEPYWDALCDSPIVDGVATQLTP